MAFSAAQRALNIYEIAELVLLHAAHERPLTELLLLQRTCSIWHSIIRRCLVLGKAPLDKPVRYYHSQSYRERVEHTLKIDISALLWIYDPILQDIQGVVRKEVPPNLYCDGKASCLDLRLVPPGVKLPVFWRPDRYAHNLDLREGCETVREVLQAIAIQLRRMPELGIDESAAIPFTLVYDTFGDGEKAVLEVLATAARYDVGLYQRSDGGYKFDWRRQSIDWLYEGLFRW
ncbi:MAG: hypothetical protein LQ347_003432 [Umbilicaria vellea]|nr:MAG: hypothetical protein LQ347_003432 [Umbilicaria vellea]